jgi:subtilisin family serine protease
MNRSWNSKFVFEVILRSLSVCFLGWSLSVSSAFASNLEGKLSNDLIRALNQQDESVGIIVMMEPVLPLPTQLMGELTVSQKQKLIKERAIRSQSAMREFVNERVSQRTLTGEKSLSKYKFFWNMNGFMAQATPETVVEIADRPEVKKIHLDRTIKLLPTRRVAGREEAGKFTYGLEKIGVPELRSSRSEITGKDVIVGILDTGIDPEHSDLKGKMIAYKDFTSSSTKPSDEHGHGTHVAGTISGGDASGTHIGVAPSVKLVIAKVFSASGSATLSGLLRAMEWIVDPDGDPKTNDRPRVVNNSWGGGAQSDIKDDPFYQAVQTWVEMDIFPSFAAGNEGPSAETIGSPGCLPNAFAVGATDDADKIARFSSRGPVEMVIDGKRTKYTKPDISAPGVNIYSSLPDGQYEAWSGTSMATPHVTGAIALLYQIKPDLTIQQVRDLITKTSQDLGQQGMDDSFGHGRMQINATVDQIGSEHIETGPVDRDQDGQLEFDW